MRKASPLYRTSAIRSGIMCYVVQIDPYHTGQRKEDETRYLESEACLKIEADILTSPGRHSRFLEPDAIQLFVHEISDIRFFIWYTAIDFLRF